MSTKPASLAISPPPGTLAWVLDELPKFGELSHQARQNMGSAIRRLCQVLERGPGRVGADLRALETLFDRASPGALGLSSARWRNIKSDVRRAVKLTGADRPVPDAKVPLTDAWGSLCQSGANPSERAVLRRLGRYCCARQIGPQQVTDQIVGDFAKYLDERVLSKDPLRILGDTVRAWNRRIAGGELVPLTRIDRSRAYTLRWADFPTSLKQDTDAWHKACLRPDPFDPDARAPVKPSTIEQRDRMIRRLATAVVLQGERAEELVGLRALITPERVKKALRFFLDRNGGKPSVQAHEMAWLAITIARHWLKLDEEEIRELRGWAKKLRPNRKGLTQKNEDRLRQFRDEKVLRALFTLPDKILAEELREVPDSRSALRIQTALAIAILSVAPMRIENLRSLDRDIHFVEAFSERDPVLQIRIDAQNVKNEVDLAYPIPGDVKDLLKLYMTRYQRVLTNGHASTLLFPGRSNAPKNANTLRRNITTTVRRVLGLQINPHLFRHISAYVFLSRHPGHYEEVRRILHHRNIQTTIDSYAGLEATTALVRYDNIVLDLKEGAA